MALQSPEQVAAVTKYKTLLRDLFVPSERQELQAILQQFIQGGAVYHSVEVVGEGDGVLTHRFLPKTFKFGEEGRGGGGKSKGNEAKRKLEREN